MTNVPKNDYVNAFKPARPPGRHASRGVHDPEMPYTPSNPLAWGPKGAWGPAKTYEQLGFEAQAYKSESYVDTNGPCLLASSTHPPRPLPAALCAGGSRADPRTLWGAGFLSDSRTWEARGKQSESTFRPNPKNLAPRPKSWKPEEPISY